MKRHSHLVLWEKFKIRAALSWGKRAALSMQEVINKEIAL
jgi:hypothetical protein